MSPRISETVEASGFHLFSTQTQRAWPSSASKNSSSGIRILAKVGHGLLLGIDLPDAVRMCTEGVQPATYRLPEMVVVESPIAVIYAPNA